MSYTDCSHTDQQKKNWKSVNCGSLPQSKREGIYMLNMEQIGYYLYMEQQQKQQEVNVKKNNDLVQELPTKTENKRERQLFPETHAPT